MADTYRSSGASEIKFLVDSVLADHIRAWARRHLDADPHGGGAFGDAYSTTTLYLDTPALDVFHRRGSNGRAKYRIRRYSEGDVVFIERKLRTSSTLAKRRTRISPDDVGKLDVPESAWFYRRMIARRLAPTCQVRYSRMARVKETPTGLARLTLDDGLYSSPIDAIRFGAEPTVPFLERQAILELKYRTAVPAVFKRLIVELQLTPGTVSKYRHAMVAIGRATVPEPVAAAETQ
jgi:hypothetical protein